MRRPFRRKPTPSPTKPTPKAANPAPEPRADCDHVVSEWMPKHRAAYHVLVCCVCAAVMDRSLVLIASGRREYTGPDTPPTGFGAPQAVRDRDDKRT